MKDVIQEIHQRLEKDRVIIVTDIDEKNGKRLIVKTPSGQQHNIIIRILNLDEARYIKIPKSDFSYELRENLWILLVAYMHDMHCI